MQANSSIDDGSASLGTRWSGPLRTPRVALLAAAATTVLSCAYAWTRASSRILGSETEALAASIQDDSFYYILPAHYFPVTGFFSFDGHARTYGFQPLYMLLLTAVSFAVRDLPALLRAALLINVTLYCATTLLIFCIVAESLRRAAPGLRAAASLIGAHLFLCNMGVFLTNSTAKENALAGFLLACCVLICVRTRLAGLSSATTAGSMGLLAGLLVICRLLPSTLLSVGLLLYGARMSPEKRAFCLAASILPIAAWAIYASAAFGRVVPTSATQKAGDWRATASALTDSAERARILIQTSEYIRRSLLLATGGEHGFWIPQPDAWEIGGAGGSKASRLFGGFMNVVLIGAVGAAVLCGRRILRSGIVDPLLLGLFLLNVGGLAITGTLLHRQVDASYYATWYLYDLPISLCILLSVVIAAACEQFFSRETHVTPGTTRPQFPFAALGLAAGCVISLACAISVYRPLNHLPNLAVVRDNWASMMIHCGHVLREDFDLRPGQRVGAFSSGALGFVLGGSVTNLDGLANDEVLAFQAAGGSIQEYLERNKLDYYVDVVDPAKLGIRATILRAEPFLQHSFPYYYIARIERASSP